MYVNLDVFGLTVSNASICPNVTFNCSAINLPSTTLRWFFNNEQFAQYPLTPGDTYPMVIQPTNTTLSGLVGDVAIQILEATNREDNPDVASFLSTMTVNISALKEAGVTEVSCGRFDIMTRTYANVTFNSSGGMFK